MITEQQFKEMFGREPENDDLDRCNCPKAGKPGHVGCGICKHNMPVWECQECFYETVKRCFPVHE